MEGKSRLSPFPIVVSILAANFPICEKIMPKVAIFLGAGASKSEGAALQGELFHKYFTSREFDPSNSPMDKALTLFFKRMFAIDVLDSSIKAHEFPTFEEVLGLTDLASMRKETFRSFSPKASSASSDPMRSISQHLVFLVAKLLEKTLRGGHPQHRDLIAGLREKAPLTDFVFISTNYDLLIDNALLEIHPDFDVDYGIPFRNFSRNNDWHAPDPEKSVSLYKPHGSLNWLFCPTCNQIEITPKEKGVATRLVSSTKDSKCRVCFGAYAPLIIPPTFYKDMSNVFLSSIWNRTEVALQQVEQVVFCGYSFPDADIHIKYLIKRAQTHRKTPPIYHVVNHHPGKKAQACKAEEARFVRFLGRGVNYTRCSFKKFRMAPYDVIRPFAP